jgi:hypothetical protein
MVLSYLPGYALLRKGPHGDLLHSPVAKKGLETDVPKGGTWLSQFLISLMRNSFNLGL